MKHYDSFKKERFQNILSHKKCQHLNLCGFFFLALLGLKNRCQHPQRQFCLSVLQVTFKILLPNPESSGRYFDSVSAPQAASGPSQARRRMRPLESQIKSEDLNNPSSHHSPTQKAQLLVLTLPNPALHSGMIVLQEVGREACWDRRDTVRVKGP